MLDFKKQKKVLVAMSGGVDSSVAAKLLVDSGYKVVGIFLHFWSDDTSLGNIIKEKQRDKIENKCCSSQALEDAKKVCQKINIPFYTLNLKRIFKKEIVNNFLNEYKQGKTPNPCIRCNKLVKLGRLIEKAKKLGFDYVASGHYAGTKKIKNKKNNKTKFLYQLYKAKDRNKDQSYFLYTLSQQELKYLLFPLADYTKMEVRQLAKKFNLPVAEKKESQEVCFIPKKGMTNFLCRHLKLKQGLIKTLEGETIGKHSGLPLYTIGQRKGINIGGIGPFYVVNKEFTTNTLYVVDRRNDHALYKKDLTAGKVNWISLHKPKFPLKCKAVIRYGQKAITCEVKNREKFSSPEEITVKFIRPVYAVTPGQSIVFYQGNEVIGGGIIR